MYSHDFISHCLRSLTSLSEVSRRDPSMDDVDEGSKVHLRHDVRMDIRGEKSSGLLNRGSVLDEKVVGVRDGPYRIVPGGVLFLILEDRLLSSEPLYVEDLHCLLGEGAGPMTDELVGKGSSDLLQHKCVVYELPAGLDRISYILQLIHLLLHRPLGDCLEAIWSHLHSSILRKDQNVSCVHRIRVAGSGVVQERNFH